MGLRCNMQQRSARQTARSSWRQCNRIRMPSRSHRTGCCCTFATEAKSSWYILKVSLLSGRSAVVCSCDEDVENAEEIVEACCRRLRISQSGNEKLAHGTEVVPATAQVGSWPGLRPRGEVSEYQLIL
mmetsp:Transcript_5370/g.11858  ORF Transcript_5370/g.11858 Transcript_5370/m.11858 type:complete len:128 (+) Transcript_5370:13-396(+)